MKAFSVVRRQRTSGRQYLPFRRRFLPGLAAAALSAALAGCGEEDKHLEPGAKPRAGEAAPELKVAREPLKELTGAELLRDPLADPDAIDAKEIEELDLTEIIAGAAAVIHFDSASDPLAERQAKELAAAKAARPAGVKFLSVALGPKLWKGLGERGGGGGDVYYSRRQQALDSYGVYELPMIVVVDSAGTVRHVGAFTRAGEIGEILKAAAAPAAPADAGAGR